MPITTETVIVAALRSGNLRRAVELLLDSYQEELFGYCARLVGPEHAALVYQRVLSLALENVQTIEGTASVRAYLFRIAREIILQHQRVTPREFPRALEEGHVPVEGPPEPDEEPRHLRTSEARLRLEPAVLEVLQLSLWHGLLLFEVAFVLDRSEAQVRQMAGKGLSILALETPDSAVAPS